MMIPMKQESEHYLPMDKWEKAFMILPVPIRTEESVMCHSALCWTITMVLIPDLTGRRRFIISIIIKEMK